MMRGVKSMEEKKTACYKDTLNLPQTTLPMRANATIKEVETQKFWEQINIYEKMIENKDKTNKFILHDGPPYLSSDKIHIGTALNKILKDIVLKYKTQRGFYSPYVPGYDGHGLPIENAVVKTVKGGRHAISKYELRQKCREFALKNLKGQEANFRRLGVLGNWENPYLTFDKNFEAHQIKIFGEMYKKGYVEKGLKPVYWCASCETALAEAEVEYADHTSTSIYVKFEVCENSKKEILNKINANIEKPLYAVIWTTTPWTIPSNMAICLNEAFDYNIFEYENEVYIIAKDLTDNFISEVGFEADKINIIGVLKGKEFENLEVKHPLYDRISKFILGNHVTLEAGCGLVHTAPGHGLEDWEVGCRYGIDVFSPLDSKGCWTDACPDLEGVPYYEGNKIVIERLKEKNALLSQKDIVHSYPHCWRCKKPVIYRATPQWFVRVDKFRENALNAIKKVNWVPKSGENRISKMVENRSDWCISRQRTWGVPIPVFYCEDCGEIICDDETINNVAKIFKEESSDAWEKYEAKDLLPKDYKCKKCSSSKIKKETDIMDVWFDSGVTWSAVVNERKEELGQTPVELYLEGSDQHRGWFQSSLLTSVAINDEAPYKNVLTHGFVLDGEGRKMSKSLGNFITPQDVIKNYSGDVLRLWAASIDYRNDVKIGDTIMKHLVEIFKKIRNTVRFLLGNTFDFDPNVDYVEYKNLEELDKFALHKLNELVKNVTASFEDYEFYKYFQYLQNFAAGDLSAFYLDIVKDRLYTAGKKSLSRRASQTVLYEIMQALIKILVPVMPHQAEEMFQAMRDVQKGNLESVLLTSWPNVNPLWNNESLNEEFSYILNLRETVTKAIEPLRANKTVGSSLEVSICINPKKQNNIFEKYKNDLANIFIVSQVYLVDENKDNALNTLETEDYTIFVEKAHGEKCERCWKYRDLGVNSKYPTICEDCAKAIEEN